MKVKISAITQYFLIYIMLLVPGSCLFAKYLTGDQKYYAIIIMYIILYALNKKYRCNYSLIFSILLLIFVVFTRLYTNGGAGISAWFQFVVCIISTQMAISANKREFLRRWINLVQIFAVISIIFWVAFLVSPSLVNAWPAVTFDTQTMGTKGYEIYLHGKGVLLYSYLEIHPTRNCGIYTEPGVYQIVLNSALFVLLFWREKIGFKSEIEYKRAVFIVLLSLITCQSTTGYIGMLFIILFFYFSRKKDHNTSKVKLYITGVMAVGFIVLLVDYAYRGTESIVYIQIIHKLFGDNGSGFNISEGTGLYRLGTIIVSLASVIKHPLGVGYDTLNVLKKEYASGLVAASVVAFAAVYGIIPWIISMYMVFKPVMKYEKLVPGILFAILFFNTTLAQTDLFYPSLMMIPLYLLLNKRLVRRGELT
ncbi:MAG: Uncharacterized protein K0S47_4270 [Herbinix sp.]|jgi:hypothetical protein|nr:Uncharacterized protein [Herbinix sp.]